MKDVWCQQDSFTGSNGVTMTALTPAPIVLSSFSTDKIVVDEKLHPSHPTAGQDGSLYEIGDLDIHLAPVESPLQPKCRLNMSPAQFGHVLADMLYKAHFDEVAERKRYAVAEHVPNMYLVKLVLEYVE
jgi:hypothetical protein